jgi:lipopolysaccharide export LptBFGC system permease protein LptF
VQLKADLNTLFKTGDMSALEWKFQPSSEVARRIDRSRELLALEGAPALEAKKDDFDYIPERLLDTATYELHNREALALVCPMFLLLGIPTGLLLRRGSQLGAFAAAVGYALIYYLLSMRLGKGLGVAGAVPQWLAAFGTTILGSLIGLVMSFFALRR